RRDELGDAEQRAGDERREGERHENRRLGHCNESRGAGTFGGWPEMRCEPASFVSGPASPEPAWVAGPRCEPAPFVSGPASPEPPWVARPRCEPARSAWRLAW